jgi:hypothetical protein
VAGWWSMPEMSPWKPRGLTFPPNSARAWVRLAVWELWMGMLLCVVLGFSVFLIVTSPTRLIVMRDFSQCYAAPPVVLPCERIAYSSGMLNVVFTALFGVILLGLAAWLLWELWSAVEPKPITDDFLRLLNDSFGHNWRNPLTWPWARVLWAYGFTIVGIALATGIGTTIWTQIAASGPVSAPTVQVETSQSFRLGQ